jgi:hypothetical protein
MLLNPAVELRRPLDVGYLESGFEDAADQHGLVLVQIIIIVDGS